MPDDPGGEDGGRRFLAALLARLAALEAKLDAGPVVGWTRAAEVLGVSVDTVARTRRRAGWTGPAWWSSPVAVREWWLDLLQGPPPPPPRKATRKTATEDAAVLRERRRERYGGRR